MKMTSGRIGSGMFAPCGMNCLVCYGTTATNSRLVKEQGLEAFMEGQKEKYTCPDCGGVISVHDMECSECGHKASV